MASEKLTDAKIRNLPPASVQIATFDEKVKGLFVLVSPGGTISFGYQYRHLRRNRKLSFGRYPDVTLAEARRLAQEAKSLVARRVDPAAEKRDALVNSITNVFQDFAQDFMENHAKRNTRSWRETQRILQNEFVRSWGRLPILQITKPMINFRLDEIVERSGPSAANHAFAVIRRCFNWAVERGTIATSPCAGMKAPAKTSERDRVLDDTELGHIWNAAERMGFPFGDHVKLQIATAQRRAEVSGMRWCDIDLERQTWAQPAASNKSGRAHTVHLNRLAVATIRSLPRIHDDLVFPARGSDNPVSGYSKWKRKLDQLSGVRDWTLHDLRRTAATGMAALKVPLHVIELVLNHRSKSLSGVAGIYNRHEYLDEQRDALERWGQHVEHLAAKDRIAASGDADTTPEPVRVQRVSATEAVSRFARDAQPGLKIAPY